MASKPGIQSFFLLRTGNFAGVGPSSPRHTAALRRDVIFAGRLNRGGISSVNHRVSVFRCDAMNNHKSYRALRRIKHFAD